MQNYELVVAAGEGRSEDVDTLIATGVDVNYAEEAFGGTALMRASGKGYAGIVTALLAANADVNKTDNEGNTALMWAHDNYHETIVTVLRAAGAVLSQKDTVVIVNKHIIGYPSFVTSIDELRSLGRDLRGAALRAACVSKHYDRITALLAATNADVNEADSDGSTALMLVSNRQNNSTAHQLILAGANPQTIEGAAHYARSCGNHRLAATLDAIAAPATLLPTPTTNATSASTPPSSSPQSQPQPQPLPIPIPQSVQFLAAGIPLQSYPQPVYHTVTYHEGLLLTEIGPWLRDVALPLAASDPKAKDLIFAVISHTYALTITNPTLADQFFQEYLLPAAQTAQDAMPAQLDAIARRMEANFALAPASLRDTQEQRVEVSQADYLAIMKPEHVGVVEEVLAECMPKFVKMRGEAESGVRALNPFTGDRFVEALYLDRAYDDVYVNAQVYSLPTVAEVLVAALCVISTFLSAHLQTTHPDLCNNPAHIEGECTSGSDGGGARGAAAGTDGIAATATLGQFRWPDVKTMLRMLAKIHEDYADVSHPWAALLDTIRFSLVSRTVDQHAAFVQQFLPQGVVADIDYGGDCSGGASDGGDERNESASTGAIGAAATTITTSSERDAELTVVRAKSTLDVPDATVKQELWNLAYKPAGLTFESMLGEGGLQVVEDADRWKAYGDVQCCEDDDMEWYGEDGFSEKALEAKRMNKTTTFKPRNPLFQQALSAAKESNPAISPYVWEPAVKLIAHPTFATEPVAMVIEVQLYLEEFLKYRKAVHCYYKITRAPHLASLAQDCRKYAKNPALAFDANVAAAAAAEGIERT